MLENNLINFFESKSLLKIDWPPHQHPPPEISGSVTDGGSCKSSLHKEN